LSFSELSECVETQNAALLTVSAYYEVLGLLNVGAPKAAVAPSFEHHNRRNTVLELEESGYSGVLRGGR
jgi:hypothetical protein